MKFDRLLLKSHTILPLIDERSRSRHISFLLDGKKVVSYGYNQGFKSHTLSSKIGFRHDAIHSEVHAILRSKKRVDRLNHLTMVNFRFRRDNSIALSKPCLFCQRVLESFGITDIYYSIEGGDFAKME